MVDAFDIKIDIDEVVDEWMSELNRGTDYSYARMESCPGAYEFYDFNAKELKDKLHEKIKELFKDAISEDRE